MRLIYLTAKTFPATTADHHFIEAAARAFTEILSKDFWLVVAGGTSENLQRISFKTLNLKMKRGMSFWYFVWLPIFIMRERLNAADAVFFSNDPNLLAILIVWKRVLGAHYQVVSEWHMLFGNWRDRFIATQSTKLITTTNHFKKLLSQRYGIPSDKILCAHGGVDLELFKNKSESLYDLCLRLGLPQSDVLVGYVGFYKTMGMSKGLDTMIKALNFIDDQRVKMVFVGGKDAEIEEYRRVAEDAGVVGRVLFIPVVSPAVVAQYEKAMDILVIPYPDKPHFRDYGFPMKVYEYMASRKPIVYSNLAIISEVLGDCAVSFIPGNAKDLSEKIVQTKDAAIQNVQMANKAREKVLNYTWNKRAENIISFLKDI